MTSTSTNGRAGAARLSGTTDGLARKLTEFGLSPTEAGAYLVLLRRGPLGAQAVADALGVTRTSAYAALRAAAERGLVDASAGYASRFTAVAPDQALAGLVEQGRDRLAAQVEMWEGLASQLTASLSALPQDHGDIGAPVEVVRGRRSMAQRFTRLQLEAQSEIATVVKAPIVTTGDSNPEQEDALRRGVRVRGLYERAVLDHPDIEPYLRAWVRDGEEARIYPGVLPLKFAVFDETIALVPLETPDDRYEFATLVVRNTGLASALRLLYQHLWEESTPVDG
jgi:sugar-specific transcriptional regulator TrmB